MESDETGKDKARGNESPLQGKVTLALDCDQVLGHSGPLPRQNIYHLRFSDLAAPLLAKLGPDLVILPLFASYYDANVAVEALQQLGYSGRITVLAPKLPRPRLVERELQVLGPGKRLTLISPDH
ncbi:MAG: hypothetical protein ABI832_23370 [bacterium]